MNTEEWIDVKDSPLFTKDEKGRWTCTDAGSKDFLAAILINNMATNKTEWWIRHCAIEDDIGLCVVGDVENDPAGWQLEDVQFYIPLPSPPSIKQLDK